MPAAGQPCGGRDRLVLQVTVAVVAATAAAAEESAVPAAISPPIPLGSTTT